MVEQSRGLEERLTEMTNTEALAKALGPKSNSDRFVGVLLILVSAAVFSSAGLFVKGVEADAWSIIFWRGLSAAIFTSIFVCWRGKLRYEFGKMGYSGLAAAVVGASGTIAFIPSFKFTSIANVSLIYAAAPFVAAVIAWLWMKERPSKPVMIASFAALGGVLLIVSGSLGVVNLKGDMLALWMTIAMAGYLCIYRRYPDTPAAGPAVLMSLLLVPIGMFFGEPLNAEIDEIVIMCLFGLVFSVASVTLAEGARRLPAAETALLSALETPLAPVWAFLFFTEVPAFLTLLGGSVIFVAVLYSQRVAKRKISNN